MTTPTDASEVIELWPDGPPFTIDGVGDEVAYSVSTGPAAGLRMLRNIGTPTLTVFSPATDTANGVGVIVAPGGGWTINAWDHEGLDVARWLAAAGYTAFVVKYRVQSSDPDQATFDAQMAAMDGVLTARLSTARLPRSIAELISTETYEQARLAAADDGRRAIAIVREQAERFGILAESVGMIGFSAGAFLAVDVALDPRDEPLAFVGAIYGGETRGAPVPADAPPLFTVVALDDILRAIVDGVHHDWSAADRSAELHLFARGGHGFGMVAQGAPSDHWTDLFLAWLADRTPS